MNIAIEKKLERTQDLTFFDNIPSYIHRSEEFLFFTISK
jgi:hypothetical protein